MYKILLSTAVLALVSTKWEYQVPFELDNGYYDARMSFEFDFGYTTTFNEKEEVRNRAGEKDYSLKIYSYFTVNYWH